MRLISSFQILCPQASLIAEEFNLQTIFIHHFSWDWFYVSAFGEDNVFNELKNFYSKKCIQTFISSINSFRK